MKKILLLICMTITVVAAYGLPVGNPADPSLLRDGVLWHSRCYDGYQTPWCDAWSVRVGFYGDYVFNRNMQVDRNEDSSHIETTEIYTNAGYLAFNLWERVDLFVTLGASNVRIHTPGNAFSSPLAAGLFYEIVTETDFSSSVGLRAALWQWGCLTVGAEGQYFHTRPTINYTKRENGSTNYRSNNDRLVFREWQAALGASYRINLIGCSTAIVPYGAIKWSHASIDMDQTTNQIGSTIYTFYDLESAKNFGYALGLTFVGCEKISFSLEGCFADELAIHVNSQIRF